MNTYSDSIEGALVSKATIDSGIFMATGEDSFYGWDQTYPWDLARRIISLSCLVEAIVMQNRLLHDSVFAHELAVPLLGSQKHKIPVYKGIKGMVVLPTKFIGRISYYKTTLLPPEDLLIVQRIVENFFDNRPWNHKFQKDSAYDPDEDPIVVMWTETFDAIWNSLSHGTPFLANSYESPVCILYIIARASGERTELLVNEVTKDPNKCKFIIRQIEQDLARTVSMYEVKIPAIFPTVLRNSETRLDIFKTAMQIRKTQEAEAFRQWITSLYNCCTLSELDQEMHKGQVLADKLAKALDQKPAEKAIQFTILSAGNKRSIFILHLSEDNLQVKDFDKILSRIFNVNGEVVTTHIREILK